MSYLSNYEYFFASLEAQHCDVYIQNSQKSSTTPISYIISFIFCLSALNVFKTSHLKHKKHFLVTINKKNLHSETHNFTVCCFWWVKGSAWLGDVGNTFTDKSHVIVSMTTGSTPFQRVAPDPEKLVDGIGWFKSSETGFLAMRNSK